MIIWSGAVFKPIAVNILIFNFKIVILLSLNLKDINYLTFILCYTQLLLEA